MSFVVVGVVVLFSVASLVVLVTTCCRVSVCLPFGVRVEYGLCTLLVSRCLYIVYLCVFVSVCV